MKYMEMMGQDTDFVTNLSKKLSPPLVTLLSSEPEVILDVRDFRKLWLWTINICTVNQNNIKYSRKGYRYL
jgi:hypothetical protein